MITHNSFLFDFTYLDTFLHLAQTFALNIYIRYNHDDKIAAKYGFPDGL